MVSCNDIYNYLTYADLHSQTLLEAWNNPIISEFRKKHLKGEISEYICGNCVNGTQDKKIIPLVPEYASIIKANELFCEKEVSERIEKYESSYHIKDLTVGHLHNNKYRKQHQKKPLTGSFRLNATGLDEGAFNLILF